MFSTQDLYTVCMKIFEGVAVPVSWFVLPLFLVRVFNGQIAGDAAEIRAAIKGLLLYFVLMVSFGLILDILLQIPQSFIPELSTTEIAEKTKNLAEKEKNYFLLATKSIPEVLLFILESVLSILYWAILILHILVMILLAAMAPIIFLMACILNIGVPVRIFFGLLIMSSCWPAMWYGFDQALPVIEKIIPNSFGKFVLEFVLTLLKGIGPAAVAYMSLNSGPGKAVVGTAEKGAKLTTTGALKGGQFAAGGAKFVSSWALNKVFKSRTESNDALTNSSGIRTSMNGNETFYRNDLDNTNTMGSRTYDSHGSYQTAQRTSSKKGSQQASLNHSSDPSYSDSNQKSTASGTRNKTAAAVNSSSQYFSGQDDSTCFATSSTNNQIKPDSMGTRKGNNSSAPNQSAQDTFQKRNPQDFHTSKSTNSERWNKGTTQASEKSFT